MSDFSSLQAATYAPNTPNSSGDSSDTYAANSPQELPRLASQTTADNPWPVSLLSSKFAQAVEKWPAAWITGQIHQINARRAGQVFMTLRDNDNATQIEVVFFGPPAYDAARFQQGDRVVLHGMATIYQARTSLSLRADEIRHVGRGGLMEFIEQLRKKLKGEGLFDDDRKIPRTQFPQFPHTVGLICAPGARAEGDVITNAQLRWPTVNFVVEHVHVQGPQCPPEVVHAIQKLDADPQIDIIIVARGGGAFEDLIGFSDESVVRATADCVTPIISAIGHEDDWTLIDLAADVRASTPTDAGKLIVPDIREEIAIVTQLRQRALSYMIHSVSTERQRLQAYSQRPSLTRPHTILDKPQQLLNELRTKLTTVMNFKAADAVATVEKLHATLTALSPQSTLNRGYAVVQNSHGDVVTDATCLQAGDELRLTLKSGKIKARAEGLADSALA